MLFRSHTITIRKNAHIGFRAGILARQDIVIGELCMIGAMSLVNKSIPADTTAVGVPCKVVKEIGYRSAADLAKQEEDMLKSNNEAENEE